LPLTGGIHAYQFSQIIIHKFNPQAQNQANNLQEQVNQQAVEKLTRES